MCTGLNFPITLYVCTELHPLLLTFMAVWVCGPGDLFCQDIRGSLMRRGTEERQRHGADVMN